MNLNPACVLIRARLWRYSAGSLNPQTAADVETHLGHCAACRREYALTRLTIIHLRAYRDMSLPASQTNWHGLPEVAPVVVALGRRRSRILIACAMAGIFLLALSLYYPFASSPVRRTVGVAGRRATSPLAVASRRVVHGPEHRLLPRRAIVSVPVPGLKPRSHWRAAERPSDAKVVFARAVRRQRVAMHRRRKRTTPSMVAQVKTQVAPQTVLMDVDSTLRPVTLSVAEQRVQASLPQTIVTRRYVMAQATVPPGKPHLIFRDTAEEIN